MQYPITGPITVTLYLVVVAFLAIGLRDSSRKSTGLIQALTAITLTFHGLLSYQLMVTESGLDLDFFTIGVVIGFTINLTLLISSIKKPLTPLFLPWFILTALGLIISMLLDNPTTPQPIAPNIGVHIIASILSYSLLTIASLQAVALAFQNWLLRHKHLSGWLNTLPPLQVMETLLFEFIWIGFILLTLSLITGMLFIDDMFAQHLVHKTFFSSLGWVFYATLLWGHHQRGWRGNTAVRWTLGGFVALIFAFWGTKLVMEILLK